MRQLSTLARDILLDILHNTSHTPQLCFCAVSCNLRPLYAAKSAQVVSRHRCWHAGGDQQVVKQVDKQVDKHRLRSVLSHGSCLQENGAGRCLFISALPTLVRFTPLAQMFKDRMLNQQPHMSE